MKTVNDFFFNTRLEAEHREGVEMTRKEQESHRKYQTQSKR